MRLSIIARLAGVVAFTALAACGPAAPVLSNEAARAWGGEEDPRYAPGHALAAEHRLTDIEALPPPLWPPQDSSAFGDAITLALEVGTDGRVTAVSLMDTYSADDFGIHRASLQRKAVEQARRLRYKPFLSGGKPVKAVVTERIPILPEPVPAPAVAFPQGDLAGARIELSRTGCLGSCPAYSVTLLGTGEVIWQGRSDVLVSGEIRSRVDPAVVKALLDRAVGMNFYGLKDGYADNVTDSPWYRVTITYGGKTKVVEDYVGLGAGMPWSMVMLEKAIDRAAGTARWIGGSEDTVPSLRAAGLDLRSDRPGEMVSRALSRPRTDDGRAVAFELIAAGAPVDVEPTQTDGMGVQQLPILAAAQAGDLKLFRLLVGHGALKKADPALLGKVLEAAAQSQRSDMVAEVLMLNPPLEQKGDWGFRATALSAAAAGAADDRASQREAVALLLARGADTRFKDGAGRTALHGAGDPEVARRLIAAGAPIEAKNDWNQTPLLSTDSEDVALVLIAAGADTSVVSKMDETIASKARTEGWKRVEAELAKRQKPPN